MCNAKVSYSKYFPIKADKSIYTEDLYPILRVILRFLEKAKVDFDYRDKYISVSQNLSGPQIVFAAPGTKDHDNIYLSMRKCSLWCKAIYQLSQMTAYCFIHCHNGNYNQSVNWIDALISESFTLFMLEYFQYHWSSCSLSQSNPSYYTAIAEYKVDIMNERGIDYISKIKTQSELEDFNKNILSDSQKYHNETIFLANAIKKSTLAGLFAYRDYVKEGTLILDTESYRAAFPRNKAVNYLCSLQDKIMRNISANRIEK